MPKQTETTGWQPIETAPKDGSCFLAAQKGEKDYEVPNGMDDPIRGVYFGPDIKTMKAEERPVVVSFCVGGKFFMDEFGNEFSENGFSKDYVDGGDYETDDEMIKEEVLRLTHWMPLPEMPND